jgi:DNA processing protein
MGCCHAGEARRSRSPLWCSLAGSAVEYFLPRQPGANTALAPLGETERAADRPLDVELRAGIVCIAPSATAWPSELTDIDGAPERLWLRGRAELLRHARRIAIVGTRAPTPYGESQARRFADCLSQAGWCIVSGLARGIDHAAHRAALDAGGATIAVLGCGVDRPWPAGPTSIEIATRGLLVSEHEPGTPPKPHHFPLRNRLISGLARAVVVIEAAHASGSLITARWAADQGRLVYALPGRVDHPMSRGAHRLLREGAQLVEDPEEIVRELGEPGQLALPREERRFAGLQARLFDLLAGETLSVDEIARRGSATLAETLVALVELEMAEAIARGPGGLYRRLG